MMTWKNVLQDEHGSIAPLAVAVCIVLVAALGLTVDYGVAYAMKSRQEQAIDAARSACMDAVGAVPAKYAEDPGLMLADTIAQSVRAQGVESKLTVWFYEAPGQSVPRSERLWVVGIQVEQQVALPFSAAPAPESLLVASSRILTAKPYAAEVVWRPQQRACGSYCFAEGASAGASSFTSIASLQGFPEEIVVAARDGGMRQTA